MKNKRFIMYCAILIIVFILIFIGYFIYKNIKKENKNSEFEYVPQEEISEEQLRQTVITLYFLDSNEYKLAPEARTIDSKQLVSNPYEVLINLLISGPKNEKLLKLIPDGTSLIKAELKDDILFLDFSSEFVKEQNLGKEQEELIIKSIVNTVTELTEVNKVMFLIDGEKDKGFSDDGVTFNKEFIRELLF